MDCSDLEAEQRPLRSENMDCSDLEAEQRPLRTCRLPVVDLAAENATAQLASACSNFGFQCIINHGVDIECQRSVQSLESFFREGSPECKHSVRRKECGYGPGLQLTEHMKAERYDTVEGSYGTYAREDYVIVNPEIAAHKERQDPYYSGPAGELWFGDGINRFPDDAFRDAQLAHYRALEGLGERLMGLAGEALASDAGAFAHVTRRHTSNVVVGYHVEGVGAPGGAQTMVSEHSDTGLMTLIQYGSNGMSGLEVKDRVTGEWLLVDPRDWPEGALLLNIGDSMHRLSNGRFLSTPHRVIDRTPAGVRKPDRLALIYFLAAGYDVPLCPHTRMLGGRLERPCLAPVLAGTLTHNFLTAPAERKERFRRWVRAEVRRQGLRLRQQALALLDAARDEEEGKQPARASGKAGGEVASDATGGAEASVAADQAAVSGRMSRAPLLALPPPSQGQAPALVAAPAASPWHCGSARPAALQLLSALMASRPLLESIASIVRGSARPRRSAPSSHVADARGATHEPSRTPAAVDPIEYSPRHSSYPVTEAAPHLQLEAAHITEMTAAADAAHGGGSGVGAFAQKLVGNAACYLWSPWPTGGEGAQAAAAASTAKLHAEDGPRLLLRYASREAFANGMEDILDAPILTMREEFERPIRWVDWRGMEYDLTTEWWYVTGTAARRDSDGDDPTPARDANNEGMSPHDFMQRANDVIARRRFWQRGGVRLNLSVGAGGAVSARCELGETLDAEGQEAAIDADGNILLPAKDAYLKLEEVLAVRLYTGPSYQPINAFLRTVGALRGEQRQALANDVDTTFTATCKHLCRAIRKLSAVATAEEVSAPLYRAVRGELPEAFWARAEAAGAMTSGELCATDTAFMSTSRVRAIFEEYLPRDSEGGRNVLWHLTPRPPSQVHRWRERGTIFCRGADISMLSQFAAEAEVLFPPCTMLVIDRRARAHELERREKGRRFLEVTAQPCFI